MPLPPALAKKLATRGILTESEGKMCTLYIKHVKLYKYYYLGEVTKLNKKKYKSLSRVS